MDLSPRQTLDELAKDLANREGDLPANDDYELPTLEPLSHDHALLSSATPDFDVEAFLLSRSHTSLTDLRVELRDYLSQLKEELVQLINDDYEAFISLSTDLRGEGARLERIHAPVEELRAEIQKSSSELLEIEVAVQAQLAERTRLREEKILLRLLFNISDSLNRLELLLLIPPPEGSQQDTISRRPTISEEDYDQRTRTGRAKHLSRVAAEYVQLLYQADKARAEDCVYVSENQSRIDRIKEILCRDLDQLFGNALQSLVNGSENSVQERARLVSDLSECFKTYDLLDIHEEAEEIFRIKVVQPFVKRTIFTGALNVPHSPIVPRTPFIPSGGGKSVPATPFTPFTAYPNQKGNDPQSYFSLSDENTRLPLLDDVESQLATLYNNILQFLGKNCVEVMEIATRVTRKHGKNAALPSGASPTPTRASQATGASDSRGGFDIMANVVWADVGRALMDELGSLIFAAGKPVEFKANYTTSKAFLFALEYLAPDLHAVQSMREHPIYATFERRWQLPVYFQLRWKEIVGDLEMSLSENRLRLSLDQDSSGGSHQASAVIAAISRCWNQDVFIAELGHRFWKLTLQIIERYKNWLKENMPVLDAQALAILRDEKAGLIRTGTPPPRAFTPGTEANEGASVSDEEKLRQLASMISDVKMVTQQVILMWHEKISTCAGLPEDVPLEEILRDSLTQLEAILPGITSQLVTILTRRCCEPVEKVRQVPGQIRTLSRRRDLPSTPSPFVGEIFKPLRDFFGIASATSVVVGGLGAPPISTFRGAGKGLRDNYGQKWASDILEAVSSRYIFHLEYMKKNEEALRRLKKGARSGFSLFGSSNSTAQDDASKDEERVRSQMILDVQRLGQDAEAFGVDLKAFPTYGGYPFLEPTMTTISAPGKVLLAGGYLVLDPNYSGLVIAASSRFYTAIENGKTSEYLIRVMSPQFIDARWKYNVLIQDDDKIEISQITGEGVPLGKNKFVQLALERTLQLVKEVKGIEHLRTTLQPGLDIAILGGNDFYSQRAQLEARGLPRTLKSLEEVPPFVPLGVTLENAHKTGMGSSAALITSLVAALLVHLQVVDRQSLMEPLGEGRRLTHNVAQYVHCLAQGKVGSGFDVSSAIFGSHIYTRFDPSVIQPLMDATVTNTPLLPILRADNDQWSYKAEPFRLPPLTRLLLADVDAGSDTPSMASKVLKWRKENDTEALELWTRLDKSNMEFVEVLSRLVDDYTHDSDSYVKAADLAVQNAPLKWDPSTEEDLKVKRILKDFKDAHTVSQQVRQEIKKMGELAGVPIEPDKQTRLLNACLDQAGVIAGGVPGAGGYDAIWVLVVDLGHPPPRDPVSTVEGVWLDWKEMNVSPLMTSESAIRGLRLEDFTKVPGLQKAVRG